MDSIRYLTGLNRRVGCNFHVRENRSQDSIKFLSSFNPIRNARYSDNWLWGSKILNAPVAEASGSVEAGKAINWLALAAAALLLHAALRSRRIGPRTSFVLAACGALNPIALNWTNSYMADSQLTSFFLCSLSAWLLGIKRWTQWRAVVLGASLLLLAGSKMSGTGFAAVLAAAVVVCEFTIRRHHPKALSILAVSVVGVTLLIATLAARTSWKNPEMAWQVVKTQVENRLFSNTLFAYEHENLRPCAMTEISNSDRFWVSLFNETTIKYYDFKPKIPLAVTEKEIRKIFHGAQVYMLGGFGPWFSAAWIAGCICLGLSVLRWHSQGRPFLLAALCCIVTALSVPLWMARYAPQLWLIPLFAAAACLVSARKSHVWFGRLTLALLAGNTLLWLVIWIPGQFYNRSLVERQFAILQKLPQPLAVYYGSHIANHQWFDRFGIRVTVSAEPFDETCVQLHRSNTVVRIPGTEVGQKVLSEFYVFQEELRTKRIRDWEFIINPKQRAEGKDE